MDVVFHYHGIVPLPVLLKHHSPIVLACTGSIYMYQKKASMYVYMDLFHVWDPLSAAVNNKPVAVDHIPIENTEFQLKYRGPIVWI